MKLISLIACVFLILCTAAYADEEVIKCIDANGNAIITTSPQDGMKCSVEKKEEAPKTKVNLLEYCENLNAQSKDIQEQRAEIDKQITDLNKQLKVVVKDYYNSECCDEDYAWSQAKPMVNRIDRLNGQSESLLRRYTEICEEMKSYKCNDINYGLSRIRSQTGMDQSHNKGYRK
jgi:hypothetical protein